MTKMIQRYNRYLQESLEGRIKGKNKRQNTLQATFYNELCKCIHMLTLLGYFIVVFWRQCIWITWFKIYLILQSFCQIPWSHQCLAKIFPIYKWAHPKALYVKPFKKTKSQDRVPFYISHFLQIKQKSKKTMPSKESSFQLELKEMFYIEDTEIPWSNTMDFMTRSDKFTY